MKKRSAALALMALYGGAVFLFDLSQPLGVAAGLPHLALVLMALSQRGNGALYLAAAAASVLTLAKLFLLWGQDISSVVAANRALTVAAFWGVATALASYRSRARRAEAEELRTRLALAEREGELHRSRELEAIAAGFAHHFNNALNAAIGIADTLTIDESAADALAQLQTIHWRAVNLVRELQSGFDATESEPVVVAVRDLVADSCARLSVPVSPEISGAAEAMVPLRGWGLAAALEAVLTNAVEAGGGAIRVRWGDEPARDDARSEDDRPIVWLASQPDGNMDGVEISIEDDGPGMDATTLSRAGEPFFTTKGPDRLGLGLLRARTAVLLHGGGLALKSAPGHGTRVTLWLPTQRPIRRDDHFISAKH